MDPLSTIIGIVVAFFIGLVLDIEQIGMDESPPPFDTGWNL